MNRLIKYADKGENVSLLQTHLNSLGYQLKVDGIFGKETLKALNSWSGNNSTVFDVSTLVCNLKLVRTQKEDCTIGDLFINEEFICNTLEDVFREKKIAKETCIPYGKYDIIINMSPKYKRLMPRLLNVPNFEGILIHNAGSSKPATEYTSGCILVYRQKKGDRVLDSKKVFDEFFDRIKNYSKITIEIV